MGRGGCGRAHPCCGPHPCADKRALRHFNKKQSEGRGYGYIGVSVTRAINYFSTLLGLRSDLGTLDANVAPSAAAHPDVTVQEELLAQPDMERSEGMGIDPASMDKTGLGTSTSAEDECATWCTLLASLAGSNKR